MPMGPRPAMAPLAIDATNTTPHSAGKMAARHPRTTVPAAPRIDSRYASTSASGTGAMIDSRMP